jgi:hypothetical protein
VSLVAAECERRGITTVVIQLLREAAERVGPPRALLVPFRHGFPLDRPHAPARQRRVLDAMLALAQAPRARGPVLVEYEPSDDPSSGFDHAVA